MSTRALYTFKDKDHAWNVYKHHDGYPTGAADTLAKTLQYAWQAPRFEADEFACAFIAASKVGIYNDTTAKYPEYSAGGGVRLMPQGKPLTVAARNCSDIEYRYEITFNDRVGKIMISAFSVHIPWEDGCKPSEKWLFETPLDTMQTITKAIEAADRELAS